MRKWTDKQQQQLDELVAQRTQAYAVRLQEDVTMLLKGIGVAPGISMENLLLKHGQVVLDMLLVHFEPTPQPGNPAGIYTPEDFIPLADAVALSKHG